jgi:hypothetical protein
VKSLCECTGWKACATIFSFELGAGEILMRQTKSKKLHR